MAPAHHAPHPKLLERMHDASWGYYPKPKAVLPTLNAANGSERQQRSERREGCLSLLGALLHYLDLVTLRVGIPQADGSFKGLTVAFLAGRAGLGQRRTERASRDLVKSGMVQVQPIVRKGEDGRHRGEPAIRRVSLSLFKRFGLSTWLKREREKAIWRRERERQRREAAASEADIGRRELALEAARLRAAAGAGAPAAPVPAATAPDTADTADAEAAVARRREIARTALAGLRTMLRGRPPA